MILPSSVLAQADHRFSKNNRLIWEHMLPIALCIIYLVAVLYVGQMYSIGSYGNSDFYSMYAPDADRIASGRFPEKSVSGPGYPVLLMAISKLTRDHFISGKLISAIAASLCGLVSFYLFRRLFGYRAAMLALPIIFVSGEFALFSIDPATDIMFLLLCLMVILIFIHKEMRPWPKAALTGALGGLAYLTRSNGLFLPVTCLTAVVVFNSLEVPLLRRLKIAAVHAFCFLATIAPWLLLNYKYHGSTNKVYLNMAVEFYGFEKTWDGIMQAATMFHSFSDVVLYDPKKFVLHYFSHIFVTFLKSLSSEFLVAPLGVLAIVSIPVVLIKGRRKEVWIVVLSVLVYFLLMNFSIWESRYYFYVRVCYIGLACNLIVLAADWLTSKGVLTKGIAQLGMVCAGLLVFSISAIGSGKDIKRLIAEQPYELFAASEYLKSVSPEGVRIMARKPHLAYLSNGIQVFFPRAKSLEELRDALKKTPADYLVYDSLALKLRPELKILADQVNTIPWLRPVYSDLPGSLVIYRVETSNSY